MGAGHGRRLHYHGHSALHRARPELKILALLTFALLVVASPPQLPWLFVGYALALTQFVMVWVLAIAYVRRADKTFDPLARKAAEKALQSATSGGAARTGRFSRGQRTGTTGEGATR